MDDLAAFLGACLDEDQRVAELAAAGHPHWRTDTERPGDVMDDDTGRSVVWDEGYGSTDAQTHIARWDPARVLAEVAAKRQILARHCRVNFTDVAHGIVDEPVCALCHVVLDEPEDWRGAVDWDFPWVQVPYPCATTLDLAAPFAGRPRWRPEWATGVEA